MLPLAKRADLNVSPICWASTLATKHRTTISPVTSGPAAAILNSSPGRRRLARQLRDAAEEPQVDAVGLDPLPPRGQRVAELVEDERAKNRIAAATATT